MPRTPSLVSLLKRDRSAARLDELCEFAPSEGAPPEELVLWFVQLVGWLRPSTQSADAKLRFLEAQLTQHPEWRANVSRAVAALFRMADIEQLLAYGGIPRDFHFFGAVEEWLASHLLPTATRTNDAAHIARLAFVEQDAAWIYSSGFVALIRTLLPSDVHERLVRALADAMTNLAHHIVALAHSPTIRTLARGERSPFRGIYEAVAALSAEPENVTRLGAIRGRVRQCLLAVEAHRAELAVRGADLNTTFLLQRMRQQLERLSVLAELRYPPDDAVLREACAALVIAVTRNASGNRLLARSADLVVQNLVDTSANVGRRYLGEEQSSWRAAFLAGAGGGALMALATIIKFLLARLHLPPLYEGLVFSMNYAGAFCAAYLLQFTIATKLPAHTATALARCVQQGGSLRARVDEFLTVWRAMVRLQFAGLIGNVIVAGPLAALIDVVAFRLTHGHVLSISKAEHVLRAQSIFGPSIVFAALTGLFLWISSLVTAAGDNWTRVSHLADRLATNVHAMRRIGPIRARAYADRVVPLASGLAGNVALGFLLGAVPAGFAIASLPVEIRHVTVSTSSVALAMAAGVGSRSDIALAIAGVVTIAAVNVVVSFTLALWLALRSANQFRASPISFALVRLGIRQWARGGSRPPAERAPESPAPREIRARVGRATGPPLTASIHDSRQTSTIASDEGVKHVIADQRHGAELHGEDDAGHDRLPPVHR